MGSLADLGETSSSQHIGVTLSESASDLEGVEQVDQIGDPQFGFLVFMYPSSSNSGMPGLLSADFSLFFSFSGEVKC